MGPSEELLVRIVLDKQKEEELLEEEIKKAMASQAYKVLRKIQEILQDRSLKDPACFERIERLVCLFEEIGLDAGVRHDFG